MPASLTPAQAREFAEAYAGHIRREEDELLPLAARLIADDVLADIGRAMRARAAARLSRCAASRQALRCGTAGAHRAGSRRLSAP